MKKSLVVAGQLMALIFNCCTVPSENFTINGQVSDVTEGTIFFLMDATNRPIDSCYLKNGRLYFKGTLPHPENLLLHATDRASKEFIYTLLLIGNENVTFSVSKNDLPWNIDVTGSVNQDVAEKLNHVEYERQKLRLQTGALGTEVSDSLDIVKVNLIKEYFNTYAALVNFKYYKLHFPTDTLSILYERLSPDLKNTIYGRAIKTQIENPPPIVKSTYYDYTAVNQNGDTISLSDIKDKYMLLHFASAACYFSQQSLPEMKRFYSRYKDKLEIVKFSADISKITWEESNRHDSIPWTSLWDGKGEYGDAVVKYGIVGTPNYVLISPDRIIIDKWFGYREGLIGEKLMEHL